MNRRHTHKERTAVSLFDDTEKAQRAFSRGGVLEHLEGLWLDYQGYQDDRFLDEVRASAYELAEFDEPGVERTTACQKFVQRYWEMYLTCSLLARDLPVVRYRDRSASGPDILLDLEPRVWVECVVPEPGTGPDAVPDLPEGVVNDVPEDEVSLRFLHAIREKRAKFARYLETGVVTSSDAQVIAINGRCLQHALTDFDPPRIARVLYGMGYPAVNIDRDTGTFGEQFITSRPHIRKRGGSHVPACLFAANAANELSGVLYAWLDHWNRVSESARDLLFIANASATVRLPVGWLSRCGHYEPRVDGDSGVLSLHET